MNLMEYWPRESENEAHETPFTFASSVSRALPFPSASGRSWTQLPRPRYTKSLVTQFQIARFNQSLTREVV